MDDKQSHGLAIDDETPRDLSVDTFDSLVEQISSALETGRESVSSAVNYGLLATYWNIGRLIVEYEQSGKDRAEYGAKTLVTLSRRLSESFGKGFSRTNLQHMGQFYLTHQICQTVSGKLSWSHYCTLLDISDEAKRGFYEREAENSRWSVRELRRQMDSLLFERVLAAKSDADKPDVFALAQEGIRHHRPADIIKDPHVLEFLDLPGNVHRQEQREGRICTRRTEQCHLRLDVHAAPARARAILVPGTQGAGG